MTASRPDSGQVRRQERGRRRMAQILDAAEDTIAEVGFEEATTNAIAARAGVSPGSLYQFFRNKDEILDGIVERYTTTSQEFWDHQLSGEGARMELAAFLDRVLGALAAFKTERPAFWVLFHGSAASPKLAVVAEQIRAGIGDRLREVFRQRAPEVSEERLELLAAITISTVRGVLPMVLNAPPERRAALLAETKALLLGYLGPALEGEERGGNERATGKVPR
ncbi:AcrR family transcriptional regulator [Lipingzhangella halophila]|uniref:AcrR family transcriptional regulator n=1 Tax=Lipingzhangella halophila TaxID=1783352 RepID=A0A7W7RMZ0_9ACTN|nr:TetR/AcrR family transcriptional regulator [Lipingzhangella halophila]MBB4934568.1 AcrR family transcriptional regulator [Lipingzhangella halophila]